MSSTNAGDDLRYAEWPFPICGRLLEIVLLPRSPFSNEPDIVF